MYGRVSRWDPRPQLYAGAMLRRMVLTSLTAAAAAIAVASPALAHIHAEPHEAQAGSIETIGFTIEHGCEGSPTTAVEVLLPAGVSDVTPEPFDGWTIRTDTTDEGDVVIYEDGSLADGQAGTFEITMTLPATPDTTVWFPMVQHCDVGELRWIEIPVEGEDEPDSPAPGVFLVGPVATTVPTVTTPVDTTPAPTDPVATTADTVAVDTTTVADSAPSTSVADDGDSNAGTIVFIASVIAVLVVAALAYTVARRGRRDDGDTPTDATT